MYSNMLYLLLKQFTKGVIIKYANTYNHPTPLTTTYNQPRLCKTIYNYLRLPTTTHNYPRLPTNTHSHLQPPATTHNHLQPRTHNQQQPLAKEDNISDKSKNNSWLVLFSKYKKRYIHLIMLTVSNRTRNNAHFGNHKIIHAPIRNFQ